MKSTLVFVAVVVTLVLSVIGGYSAWASNRMDFWTCMSMTEAQGTFVEGHGCYVRSSWTGEVTKVGE